MISNKLCRKLAAAAVLSAAIGFTGCGGGGSSTGGGTASGALVAGGASRLYAGDEQGNNSSDVFEFPLGTSSANLAPGADINSPNGITTTAIASDSAGNIYAGGLTNVGGIGEVLVYPAGSTGMATPTRTILNIAPGLSFNSTAFVSGVITDISVH